MVLLNTVLEEMSYVTLPPEYEQLVPEVHSIRLLKALYGLERTPR